MMNPAQILLILCVALLGRWLPAAAHNGIRPDGRVDQWLVLGPFPNEKLDVPAPPEGVTRSGFQIDFLESLGGEANARPTSTTEVAWGDTVVRAAVVETGADGRLDYEARYPDDPYSVVYAYATVRVDSAQDVHLFVGHDDCAKIWLNGELVHRYWTPSGMGLIPRQFHLPVRLVAGDNRLLVKVENWGYAWGFLLELFDQAGAAPMLQDREERRALAELQERYPRPRGSGSYLIGPGSFPDIVWDDPESVAALVGDVPLQATWYDGNLQEVSSPVEPGRYVAYVTGRTPDGRPIRRAVAVYCRDPNWQPWYGGIRVYPDYFANSGFDSVAFMHHRDTVAPMLGDLLVQQLATEETGAVVNAYWHELRADAEPVPYETPDLLHNDFQVRLKRQILGIGPDTYPALRPPRPLRRAARVLRIGSVAESGMKADAGEQLRQLCRAWYDESGEPFNVLVARHGVIVLHEAFGPCALDQKFSVASITKAVAGLLFARFLDQGLIELDEPVGKYLPDFPTNGPRAITVRQLFTHTTGLEGHGMWGGLGNAWLDNVVVLGLDKLPVGQVHVYNGMGYDLAGKVMEVVGGCSVQRLAQEQLWLPLGIEDSSLSDLGFSAVLNAQDIARMAQLLLNEGRYGQVELFSAETAARLLPCKLSRYYPEVDVEWGIGLSWRRLEVEGAERDYVLSRDLVGHGSASSCILVADLEHDLVIAQARRTGGKAFDKYYRQLLETVEAGLADGR